MTIQHEKDGITSILKEITRFYIESDDFNGIPVFEIARKFNISYQQLADKLGLLIKQGLISVVYGDIHPNPHIKAFPDEPKDKQLSKLNNDLLIQACVYPASSHLQNIVDCRIYEGKPYTKELALGAPQLGYKAFDLSVLEYYRNDSRYYYKANDIDGSISVSDSYFESESMAESDKVVLQTFGFYYDSDLNRAVAVFIRYLSDLTPEHQQIWKSKELTSGFVLHPDYYRSSILGDWGTKVPIHQAFIEELQVINKMSDVMNRPHLFKEDFSSTNAPREFSFLLRPTSKELNAYIHLLDKTLSENINRGFLKKKYQLKKRKHDQTESLSLFKKAQSTC